MFYQKQDLSTVTCSIGIQLTEAELRLYVTQITGSSMEGCDAVTCVIDFKNFLFLMAVILTVSTKSIVVELL